MMTTRERWLAAVRMQPVDRLPFWPKINKAYAPPQEAPFCDMEPDELHEFVGSDLHVSAGSCVREVRQKTAIRTESDNGTTFIHYETPHGSLRMVRKFDKGSWSTHPTEHPVKKLEDVKIMTECFEDARSELDEEALEASRTRVKEIGETAVTTASIGVSPLMDWVEHLAGIELGHHLLFDAPGEVEALFDAKQAYLRGQAEIVAANTPADLIYLSENTSTTLISPQQFRTYCYKHILELAEIINAHGKHVVLHMCGHLKDVLSDLNELPVSAFEAFTSPTVGNTTLLDGRTQCPEKCLIGGTNATLWTYSADRIIEQIEADLAPLPHHRGVVITSAGVMPPLASPETIKTVGDWVKSYDARM